MLKKVHVFPESSDTKKRLRKETGKRERKSMMKENIVIGYGAFRQNEQRFEGIENGTFIADSRKGIEDFIANSTKSSASLKECKIRFRDIILSSDGPDHILCMEPKAFQTFCKAADKKGMKYEILKKDKNIVRVNATVTMIDIPFGNDDIRKCFIRFSSHSALFVFQENICLNPDCQCTTAVYSFFELKKDLKQNKAGITFSLKLDLKTNKETSPAKRSNRVQKIVKEFIEHITPEKREELLEKIRKAKGDFDLSEEDIIEKRLREYRMTPKEVLKGPLLSYTNTADEEGSILEGGGSFSFRFQYNERDIIVEDLYCVDPGCHCKTVHFIFSELTKKNKEYQIKGLFMAKKLFGRKMEFDEKIILSKKESNAFMTNFENIHKNLPGLVEKRYYQMKEVGRQNLRRRKKP